MLAAVFNRFFSPPPGARTAPFRATPPLLQRRKNRFASMLLASRPEGRGRGPNARIVLRLGRI